MTRTAWRLPPDPRVWVRAENLKTYYALGFALDAHQARRLAEALHKAANMAEAAVRAVVQQPESVVRNDHPSGRAPVHVDPR